MEGSLACGRSVPWNVYLILVPCVFIVANIAPDSTFQKEIKDIKQTAEQALVNALTRFHKRRLDSLRNKLESRPTFSSRKRTHVNRQSRSEWQSASNIVNNDVKLAE